MENKILLLLSILIFSLTPVAIKKLLNLFNSNEITFLRIVFISLFLYVFQKIKKKYTFLFVPFVVGIIEPGINSLVVVYSLNFISPVNSIILVSIMPLTQHILEKTIFKYKFDYILIISSIISILGIFLYLTESNDDPKETLYGNVLIIYSFAILSISQIIIKKHVSKNKKNYLNFTLNQLMGASFVVILIFSIFEFNYISSKKELGLEIYFLIIFISLSLGLPILAVNKNLASSSISETNLILLLVIPCGFIWALLLNEEVYTFKKVLGCTIVVLGVSLKYFIKYIKIWSYKLDYFNKEITKIKNLNNTNYHFKILGANDGSKQE